MENGQVKIRGESTTLVNSIFSLFTKLTGVDNENPKYCVELIKNLHLNHFNVGSKNNLEYSVKRLIKGLGSTRLYSQCGCFASLSCLLKFDECSMEDILHALENEQQSTRGICKAETVAQNVRCLLACAAIIYSEMFFLQSSEIKQSILNKLIDAGKKKTYFSVVIYKFVIDLVNWVNEDEFKNVVWPICTSELLNNNSKYNFNQLHLLINCFIKCPCKVEKWLQVNSTSIESILIKAIGFLGSNSLKNDHSIYENISQFLSQNVNFLPKCWQVLINENSTNNLYKDKLIILFFHLMNYLKDGSIVPYLLHPEFVKIIVKVLSSKKKKLKEQGNYFKKAKAALTLMLNLANSEATPQDVKFDIVIKLLLYPTNLKFDMKTGLKCIQSLISYLNLSLLISLTEILQNIITGILKKVVNEKNDTEEWSLKEKELAFNFLVKIIHNSAVSNIHHVKIDLIKFLFDQAFLKNKLFHDVKILARESFYKSIVLQMPSLKDLLLFLDELAIYINNCIKNKNLDVEEEIIEVWKKHFTVIKKLMKKSNKKLFIAVHVLLVYMGLQLFIDKELAKSGIEELLACYDRLKKINSKNSLSENLKEDNIRCNKDPHWTEVVTDLILSLLSRENKLWRHVVSCIFSQMVIYATPTALNQIIEALKMTEEVVTIKDNELEEKAENDFIEPNVSQDQGKPKSEAKIVSKDSIAQSKNNECLKLALHNALNYSESFSDNESVDMDQMDSDDEKRLNDNLSEAFRLFKRGADVKKKKINKQEEALTHFKLRVLDLVEIYIKNKPSVGGCLDLIHTLFDILEFSIKNPHQRFLQNRVDSILKQICHVRTFSDVNSINEKIIKKSFKLILKKKEICNSMFTEISPRFSDCVVFLVRCSQLLPNKEEVPLLGYECNSLLKTLFSSRDSKIPLNIFEKLLNTKWRGNFIIVRALYELLTALEVKIFKKIKILELLKVFYKNEKFFMCCEENIKRELYLVEENFIKNFIIFLKNSENETEKTVKKIYLSFLSNILAFVNVIRSNKDKRNTLLQKNSSWGSLIFTMAQINIINNSKKTKSQLFNLVRLFNLSATAIPSNVNSDGKKLKRTLTQSEISKKNEVEPKKKKKKKEDNLY